MNEDLRPTKHLTPQQFLSKFHKELESIRPCIEDMETRYIYETEDYEVIILCNVG